MKNVLKVLALASATLLLGSCKSLKLSNKQVYVEPKPLEVVANQVQGKVHLNFPKKSFPKKAVLRITPIIRYAGGERSAKDVYFQGEKAYNNYAVVPYKSGANVSFDFAIPFVAQMKKGVLSLKLAVKKGSSWKQLPELRIAEGVRAVETYATARGISPAFAPDGFQRVIKEAYDANIMFQIQRANVRSSEANKEDVEEWKYIVQNAKETPNQRVSVEVQAYASPDGNQDLNERLSESREKNTRSVLKREFRKQRMSDVEINAHYTAEDWEGFKKLVEASDLQDKDLVLRVLEMYPDAESREREIKNISAVFSQLADEILPKLRRSRLVANIEIVGKTDEEILDWLNKAPGFLSIEELLHAATLIKDPQEQIKVYRIVNKIFPKDYRAYNNIGAVLYQAGNLKLAEVWFKKAQKCANNNVTKMNKGLIYLNQGKDEQAMELIANATDVPEGGQALGYLFLKQGEYAKAKKLYGDYASNNAVIAHLLNKDYRKANKVLKSISKPDATTYYLKAILSARQHDKHDVQTALKEAVKLNPRLLNELENDIEFTEYIKDADIITALVKAVKEHK